MKFDPQHLKKLEQLRRKTADSTPLSMGDQVTVSAGVVTLPNFFVELGATLPDLPVTTAQMIDVYQATATRIDSRPSPIRCWCRNLGSGHG